MATMDGAFCRWLTQAGVAADRLTVEQTAVLQAACRFLEQVGTDYYSGKKNGRNSLPSKTIGKTPVSIVFPSL